MTLADVADLWKVSRARAGQIEKRALAKLKEGILREMQANGETIEDWMVSP